MSKNYFTDRELFYSHTAEKYNINNIPPLEALSNLRYIRNNYLNPLREKWGSGIIITSGYRSVELNKKVGGVNNSNHLFGYAVDLVPTKGSVKDLYNTFLSFLQTSNLPYDELIFEKSKSSIWVHFAMRLNGINRQKVLNIIK